MGAAAQENPMGLKTRLSHALARPDASIPLRSIFHCLLGKRRDAHEAPVDRFPVGKPAPTKESPSACQCDSGNDTGNDHNTRGAADKAFCLVFLVSHGGDRRSKRLRSHRQSHGRAITFKPSRTASWPSPAEQCCPCPRRRSSPCRSTATHPAWPPPRGAATIR